MRAGHIRKVWTLPGPGQVRLCTRELLAWSDPYLADIAGDCANLPHAVKVAAHAAVRVAELRPRSCSCQAKQYKRATRILLVLVPYEGDQEAAAAEKHCIVFTPGYKAPGGLQFTGQEKVVANFGFCFLGGGFDDLRFLQQQHRQSQQLWLTADDPETLQAHVARRVKHPSPHDSLQLQRGENRIQEALDGRACLHGADCWSAVSWLGRRGVLQVLGAQQTVWSDATAAVAK